MLPLNKTLDRMARSAVSRRFQVGRHRRAPRTSVSFAFVLSFARAVNRKCFTLWLFVLLLCAAGYGCGCASKSKRDVTQRVFGTQEVFDALLAADQVTAQRLHHREGAPHGSDRLNDYESDPSVTVLPSRARELTQLLQQHSSYNWKTDEANTCVLDYGVLLSFRSPQRIVRVALCFNCNDLGVYDGIDGSAKPLNNEGDFGPVRDKLVIVVKNIFPSDPAIQALRERSKKN